MNLSLSDFVYTSQLKLLKYYVSLAIIDRGIVGDYN